MSESIISRLFSAPRAQLNPLDDRYYQTSQGPWSRAGVQVSAENAMRVSAVYRCCSILANVLAMFPKGMFEKLDRGRREAPDHPLDPIISFKPSPYQTAFEFWRLVCFHLVLRQNAYVQILPGASGRGWVGGLVPLHPDRIRHLDNGLAGRRRYEYTRKDGQKFILVGGVDLWHLQGLSDDGLRGLSMMELATDSIGVASAAERHTARFFERGVNPSGILEHPKTLKVETAREMSESFSRKYGGEFGAGRVPVLWEGMQFKAIGMTMKDAEFLDQRKFSVSEIARWFGVPPHMVGDVERSTSWGTGIEQQGLHFLVYSLAPWVAMIEDSIRYTLVVQPDRFYAKMNVSAILRMDAETQASVFATLIDKGVLSPNECRELLDRNPREGGDEFVDPAEKPEPPAPRVAPAPEPDAEPEDEEPEAAAIARRLSKALAGELIAEETKALRRMARQNASDADGWRSAAAAFYGRFARRIEATGLAPKATAKDWCRVRLASVLSEGGLAAPMPTAEQMLGGLQC